MVAMSRKPGALYTRTSDVLTETNSIAPILLLFITNILSEAKHTKTNAWAN